MCARVLVIDDDPVNVDLLAWLLRAYGHEAILALGGESALHEAKAEVPDLVLCDIHMPHMDGFEVLRRFRDDDRFTATPIVGVTALAMVGDREKIIAAGFDGYLTKPITPESFVPEIEKFLPPELVSRQQPRTAMTTAAGPTHVPRPRRKAGYALVVDDSPPNVELFRHLISSLGVEVRAATNADDALRLAHDRTPSLIISDIHMPGRSGLEFLEAVRLDEALRHVPFLLISSSTATAEEQRKAAACAADGLLLRPLDAEAMLEHLVRWIPVESPS